MMLRHAILAIFVVAALGTPAPLQAQQLLRVGTNEIGSPWSFHDAAPNSERGIAIDLVTEIGKDTRTPPRRDAVFRAARLAAVTSR
jgi:ABC-type amino acid transport substrate-binding protein